MGVAPERMLDSGHVWAPGRGPEPPSFQARLLRRLAALRRYGWLAILAVLLAVGAALGVSSLQHPVYRASMSIVVGQGNGFFQPEFGSSVTPFTQTMTNLFQSDVVAQTVIDGLRLHTTPGALLAHVKITTQPESSVLEVTYDSTSKTQAPRILAALGDVFTALVKQKLNAPKGSTTAPITASIFDPAHIRPGRVSPRPVRNALIAGVLGLVVGLGAVFLRDSFSERIRTREDAEKWFRAPILGSVPRTSKGHALAGPFVGAHQATVEALRTMRGSLEFPDLRAGGPIIVVTSAVPKEGKTTLASGLAVALATSGKEVICVDADFRRPKLAEYLGRAEGGSGLAEVLAGTTRAADALRDVPLRSVAGGMAGRDDRSIVHEAGGVRVGRLRLLAHGALPPEPADLFRAESVSGLLADLKTLADYVVFDTPPLLLSADAFPLVRAADSVILAARADLTSRAAAEEVAATLDSLGVLHRFVVLNGATGRETYGHYGGYGQSAPAL